jgi:protein phosphatase
VPGQIAGLSLSSVHETSGTRLDDLTVVAQDRVKQGIQADDEPDAQRRLAELTSDTPANPNLKPTCPPTTTPSSSASPAPTTPPPATAATATPPATSSPAGSGPATTPDAPPAYSDPPVDPTGCRAAD